jgi:hypothetical protein
VIVTLTARPSSLVRRTRPRLPMRVN